MSENVHEDLAEAHYTALEWSGCAGSTWDRVPESHRRPHYEVAAAVLPVVERLVAEARVKGRGDLRVAEHEAFDRGLKAAEEAVCGDCAALTAAVRGRDWAEAFLAEWARPYFGEDSTDVVACVQRAAKAATDRTNGQTSEEA